MEPADKVALDYTYEQKKQLNPEEMSQFQRFFKNYDKNGDATMDQKEFKQIMVDMGYRSITDDKVQEMLAA